MESEIEKPLQPENIIEMIEKLPNVEVEEVDHRCTANTQNIEAHAKVCIICLEDI